MRCLIYFICLIIALPCTAREVYKWTSEQGQTYYSDIYQPGVEGVEQVSISVSSTHQTEASEPSPNPEQGTKSTAAYQVFAVAQPPNDETIDNNAGVVEVGLRLSPQLIQGHVIHVYVDGTKLKADLTSTQFSLNKLKSGTHTLQAKVVDAEGKPQITSSAVIFHLP